MFSVFVTRTAGSDRSGFILFLLSWKLPRSIQTFTPSQWNCRNPTWTARSRSGESPLSLWNQNQNPFGSDPKLTTVCGQVQRRAAGDAQAAILWEQRTRGQGGGVPAPAVGPGQEGLLQPPEVQRHRAVRRPEPGSELSCPGSSFSELCPYSHISCRDVSFNTNFRFYFILIFFNVCTECFRPQWLILLTQELCKYSVCRVLLPFVNPLSLQSWTVPAESHREQTKSRVFWIFQALKGS